MTTTKKQLPAALTAALCVLCLVAGLAAWYFYAPAVSFAEAGVEVADADAVLTPNPSVLQVSGKNIRFQINTFTSDDGSELLALSTKRYSAFYLWLNDLLDAHFNNVRHDTAYYPLSDAADYLVVCADDNYLYSDGQLTALHT